MAVEKAILKVLYTGKAKQKIPCMFNPETLSFKTENKWKDDGDAASGHGIVTLEFKGQANGTVSLPLFFDTTDTGKYVTTYTDKILAAMEIEGDASGASATTQNAEPPCVQFKWGQLKTPPCVITTADLELLYFSSQGVPLRAKLTIGLKQYTDPKAYPKQNPTSGTLQPHRVHRVQPGETLDRISARYYRDSTKWRMLAVANGIEDPLAIRPGSLITVPMLDAP
ncbi:MAG: LysM peptidoglycan-binding domain-containing protein [Trebonia sp.]